MRLKTKKNAEGFQITVGNASLTVNPLTTSELSKLRNAHTTIKRGVEKTNGREMTAEMFDRVVLGWDILKDKDGKQIGRAHV